MSDQRAFRGVWIPADIWMSRELSLQEKVMLVEIDSLQHPERGCFKSNKALAEFFQLSPSRVSEIISSLAKKGLVRVEQIRSGKQIVERRIFMAQPFEKPKGGVRETEGGYSGNRENPTRNLEGGYSENREERGSGLRGTPSLQETREPDSSVKPVPNAGAGDWTENVGDLDDDGRPLEQAPEPRQRPMTFDWQPDAEQLAVACLRRGLPSTLQPDAATLADFTAHFAEKPFERRTQQGWHERLAKWLAENRHRQPRITAAQGGPHHAQRPAARHGLDRQAEREAVREQLANPNDTSWADGWWPEDAAEGPDTGIGEPGLHPVGGDFSKDVGERLPEYGSAEAGAPRAGAGNGEMAGAARVPGGRAGDERTQGAGEYLAADDPGTGEPAGANAGGLRYAGDC